MQFKELPLCIDDPLAGPWRGVVVSGVCYDLGGGASSLELFVNWGTVPSFFHLPFALGRYASVEGHLER